MRKFIPITLITVFITTSLYTPQVHAGEMVMPVMPKAGSMVNLSPTFVPAHLQGIVIHPDNALQFDFLIHKGDGNLSEVQKKEEYNKLIKYFLASLTVPDADQWVNLSPYEHNRIIKDNFGKTEMGRDLLAQDYLLKQITSSLMYPESGLGKDFWNKVYEKAYKELGNTNIPVNTFNKVWIVPSEAVIHENGNTAFIVKSHLKVMLEEDYVSLEKHTATNTPKNQTHALSSKAIKDIILPALEKEVNEGKNFAQLRQVFSGMILATWYKKALKESLLGKMYADKAKVKGVDQNPKNNEEIYAQYLQAFKKGVYNYIKEDADKYSNQVIPRKYFAGGITNKAMASVLERVTVSKAQFANDVTPYGSVLDSANAAMSAINNINQARWEGIVAGLDARIAELRRQLASHEHTQYEMGEDEARLARHRIEEPLRTFLSERARYFHEYDGSPQFPEDEGISKKRFDYAMNAGQIERLSRAGITVLEDRPGSKGLEMALSDAEFANITPQKALQKFASTIGWSEAGMGVVLNSFSRIAGNKVRIALYIDSAMTGNELNNQLVAWSVILGASLWSPVSVLAAEKVKEATNPPAAYILTQVTVLESVEYKEYDFNKNIKLYPGQELGNFPVKRGASTLSVNGTVKSIIQKDVKKNEISVTITYPYKGAVQEYTWLINKDTFWPLGVTYTEQNRPAAFIMTQIIETVDTKYDNYEISGVTLYPGQTLGSFPVSEKGEIKSINGKVSSIEQKGVKGDVVVTIEYQDKGKTKTFKWVVTPKTTLPIGVIYSANDRPAAYIFIQRTTTVVDKNTTVSKARTSDKAMLTRRGFIGGALATAVSGSIMPQTSEAQSNDVQSVIFKNGRVLKRGDEFNYNVGGKYGTQTPTELNQVTTRVKVISITPFGKDPGGSPIYSIVLQDISGNANLAENKYLLPYVVPGRSEKLEFIVDKAMSPYGGIDLNAANLDLVIKRDGKGVPLPIAQQDMAQLSKIEGFVPRIIEIRPVMMMPQFSHLLEK